jgi:hypothetical protein
MQSSGHNYIPWTELLRRVLESVREGLNDELPSSSSSSGRGGWPRIGPDSPEALLLTASLDFRPVKGIGIQTSERGSVGLFMEANSSMDKILMDFAED